VYDAVPAALKQHRAPTLRLSLSAFFFYLAYLSYIGSPLVSMTASPLPLQTVYSLCGVGSLLGLSALGTGLAADQIIIRVFLLASLDTVRLENASGAYVDVKLEEIQLEKTNTDLATLMVKV